MQETGQQAISELTRMLGLLRGGVGRPSYVLSPQPGVAQLPELVERLTGSGLGVQLASVGDVRSLPPGVDLTVFRIVQEALTNTLKHADRALKARVELRYLPQCLEIEVTDNGTVGPAAPGSGLGLVGMSERVSVFGGSMQAHACARAAFRVRVELPLDGSMIRVLVADDQALVRGGFRSILETQATSTWSARPRTGRTRSSGRGDPPGRGADGHPDAAAGRDRGDARDLWRRHTPKVLILTTFDVDDYV